MSIADKLKTIAENQERVYEAGRLADTTYLFVDEAGNEVVGVLVEEKEVFTATPNDIRMGAVAATESGVTVGEKLIPSYLTCQGSKVIMPEKAFDITNLNTNDEYDYTKLQVIICVYNSSLSKSVAAEMISIDNSVYNVRSTESISAVNKNHETKSIELGVVNTFGTPCVIRYFMYKEIK